MQLRFNERFAVQPARPEDLHCKLHIAAAQLNDVLCHREQRCVGAQLTLSYDRLQIILERTAISETLTGKYVELYDFADRPMQVRWNRNLLPYRTFQKDQRVTHAVVVESCLCGSIRGRAPTASRGVATINNNLRPVIDLLLRKTGVRNSSPVNGALTLLAGGIG